MNFARPVLVLLAATVTQVCYINDAQAAQQSPLLGMWSLDVEQMQAPAEMRPKSVTITFAEAGEDKWSTKVSIVAPDDSVREMTGI